MFKLKKVAISGLAVAGFLASSIANVAHADATIVGNGAFSVNRIAIEEQKVLDIRQTNNSDIQNTVVSNANSGGNQTGFNTGGSTSINTGPTESNVNIKNAANLNQLQVSSGCGCESSNAHVVIGGNGAFSYNSAAVDNQAVTRIAQDNINQIRNQVLSNTNSGDNGGGVYHNPNYQMSYPQQQSYSNSYDNNQNYHSNYSQDSYSQDNKSSYHEDLKRSDNYGQDQNKSGYQKDDKKDYSQGSSYSTKNNYNETYQRKTDYNQNSYSNNWSNNSNWMNNYWGMGYGGGNTGGNTRITTGAALSNVYIDNMANANILRY